MPTFVSKSQLCAAFGISLATVNRKISDGTIPVVKLGRRVLIPAAFITSMSEAAR
jgi:excisionase family DNA binding protein